MREANPIGLSSPLGNLCDRTAPKPYGEASQAKTMGNLSLK